jgi:hypothetical protein
LKPAQPNIFQVRISKIPNTVNRTGGVAQAVESLTSKHDILSSNPITYKKKPHSVISCNGFKVHIVMTFLALQLMMTAERLRPV